MSYYDKIKKEEGLKTRVAQDWFASYDPTPIIGNIDFSVAVRHDTGEEGSLFTDDKEKDYLLWAEAKIGTKSDIYESFVQLILTIGRARTYDDYLPPKFLGAFDAEKMAFLPYSAVMEVFTMNDFNWNVTPSDHQSREFRLLLERVRQTLDKGTYIFNYTTDGKELARFIRENFRAGDAVATIRIDKNNFTHIYRKWCATVMPTIAIDWAEAKKENLLDADFYLADILSIDNKSIKDKLFVLLENDKYRYNVHRKSTGALVFEEVPFNDGQKAHTHFWQRYSRPPKEEYWDYIVDRRDLLVPQDIRERKGSFYTPSRWVELSQEYIARELGEDWQDEYYVWDCCAGTGNLLAGLTNKYNIFASTLDDADVRVMHDLISTNHLNLLANHVFQFDFLNDSFDRLPNELRNIINDPKERQKLIIYINPPYAEATTATTVTGTGQNKSGVAIANATYLKYKDKIGKASNELFAQFFIRIYDQLSPCVLAEFFTLKILQARNFSEFRNVFQARLAQLFVVPANTFDNVQGQFPIGFFIWRTEEKETFAEITADVYDKDSNHLGTKRLLSPQGTKSINEWWVQYKSNGDVLGMMSNYPPDFQNQSKVCILSQPNARYCLNFTAENLIPFCVYLAVRQCIAATWLNDRDQFLWPKDSWQEDKEFQSDCLVYTLFHGQNRISAKYGVNHWIPFTEEEVDAKERFASHFMSDYLRGAHKKHSPQGTLFTSSPAQQEQQAALTFSPAAQAVLAAGRELWRYYHRQQHPLPNASFYDIRLHFQGTNDKGKMNPDSKDAEYTRLITNLRQCLRTLAAQIAPKVYAHGFLLATSQ